MYQAHIIATGSYTPTRILSNNDIQVFVDTTDEWITRRTGINERRIATSDAKETTTHMAKHAALKALSHAGVHPRELDTIVVGTVTPDRQFPSTACMIQKEINAVNAAAYDLSAGCSGFLYAMNTANNAIRCGASRTALVIGVERLSSVVNWKDRSTCVLLGDGAGAVLLKRSTEPGGILSIQLRSDGSLWDLLFSEYGNNDLPLTLEGTDQKPFHLKMEGNRLFKHAVSLLTDIASEALHHNGLTSGDVTLCVPHQANIRIINAVSERLGISMDRIYTNLHKYGNTSSASIPLALDEAFLDGLLACRDHLLMISFGAGLTWGASIIEWTL